MEGRRSYKPHTGVRFPHRLPIRWWAKANGAPRVCETRSSRFDSGRSPQSNSSGRRVIGSPPASGAGAWRFESSRPDHSFPACRVVTTATRPAVNRKDPGSNPGPTANLHLVVPRRGRAAMRPPFKRNQAGSTPAGGTNPGFVQQAGHPADYRRIGVRILEPGPRRRSVAGGTAPS
jgi:hypothetical protein